MITVFVGEFSSCYYCIIASLFAKYLANVIIIVLSFTIPFLVGLYIMTSVVLEMKMAECEIWFWYKNDRNMD